MSSQINHSPPQLDSHSTAVHNIDRCEQTVDSHGRMFSLSGGVVHKHPFRPVCLPEEPTRETVFRDYKLACSNHCRADKSRRPVRVFIGPIATNWMLRHQRWWIKTAGKLEGSKSSEREKIRRRQRHSAGASNDSHNIFGSLHKKNRSTDSLSSVESLSGSDDAQGSVWTMSESESEMATDGGLQHGAAQRGESRDSAESLPRQSLQAQHRPNALGLYQTPTPSPQASPAPEKKTQRKSSLSMIKNLFRRRNHSRSRSDTSTEHVHRSFNSVSTESSPPTPGEGTPKLSLAESLPPIGDSQNIEAVVAKHHSVEPTAKAPTPSSLRRIAVTKRARSVTWQSQVDGETTGPTSPVPSTNGNKSRPGDSPFKISPPPPGISLAREVTGVSHGSSRWAQGRAMAAKVKAYYHRHAQVSETAVILSSRAVVRRERASQGAFATKYNEATCRKYRQGSQEWTEMWLALTKRGLLFYLTSSKRPTVQVFFPPYISVAPHVSLFSTLDFSIAITYHSRHEVDGKKARSKRTKDKKAKETKVPQKTISDDMEDDADSKEDSVRVVVIKFPSPQIAHAWYREIGRLLLIGRELFPQNFLGLMSLAAQPAPDSIMVNIPELGIKVQVKLGRHNSELSQLLSAGIEDSALRRQWRCETTTVWHVRRDVVNALLSDPVVGPRMGEWLNAESMGLLTIGMAWRRFDRLEWVMPCASTIEQTDLLTRSANEMVVGPQMLEGTHSLEMRILQHYPDTVNVDERQVAEPLAVEGFVMLKRDKQRRTEMVVYHPTLMTSHDCFLFFIHAPRASKYLDVSQNACEDPVQMADADEDMDLTTIPTNSFMSAQSATSEGEPVVRYYHPDTRSCPKQISLARYMIDITDVEQIVPYNQEDTDADEADDSTTSRQASESPSRHSMDSRLRCKLGDRQKGKKLGFLRSKHARQAACKFKIVTRAGSSVVLWTSSEECMHEWVKRLTDLRDYWLHRRLADALVRSQVCTLNYPIQGHRSRERDMIDWNDEQAWADRAIWHACLSLGCRDIIMAGVLYRKRHRHQGMRRVFCILTRGRLIEYSYPKSYSVGTQSLFSDRIKTDNPSRADLFGDALPTTRILAENARDHPGNIDDDDGDMQTRSSKERLLFAKSRSLSLRRCYVLSRFVDDLSTNDIMCEPWVMTDISNYSGLRLADRIYADGIVSHELVQDCIFTLWRPIFIPRILRSNKKNTVTIPEVLESTESEMSSDDEIQQLLQQSSASSSPSHHGRKSVDAVSSPPNNVSQKPTRMSADMLRRSGETSRKSSEASRRSADSARKSVKPVDTTKPGAYRVGDNIMVNVDDRHDGIKRMGAIGMVSSMRRRIGVYKARTSAEMEQWVMAINQEISRLIADDEW